jgi:hypothetical protein
MRPTILASSRIEGITCEESSGSVSTNGAQGTTNDSRTTHQVWWASGLSAVNRGRFGKEEYPRFGFLRIDQGRAAPYIILVTGFEITLHVHLRLRQGIQVDGGYLYTV